MNDDRANQGLQPQPDGVQRRQSGQQNQRGETRQPQHHSGEQNQKPDLPQREGLEGANQGQLNNGAVGGADPGAKLEPGRTGDGGAER